MKLVNNQTKQIKVLIVEDSLIQAQMFKLVFVKDDCNIIFAENGDQALQVLTREVDVDLIITDINMPEMNGIEFIDMVKRTSLAKCPIIVISTSDNLEMLEQAVESGAAAYVVKPWNLSEIQELIHNLLE